MTSLVDSLVPLLIPADSPSGRVITEITSDAAAPRERQVASEFFGPIREGQHRERLEM